MNIIKTACLLAGLLPASAQAVCTWLPTTLDTSHYLEAALASHQLYWAVSDRDMVLTSSNLADWTLHSGLSASAQAALNWADVVFVSSGSTNPGGGWGPHTVTTADGVSWTTTTTPSAYELYDVTYRSGGFVAVGLWGSTVTSADGQTWQGTGQSIGPLLSTHLFGVTGNGGQLVGVGTSGFIYSSTDGSDWVNRFSAGFNDLNDVAWSGKEYIAVGDNGIVAQSSNGTTWSTHVIDPTKPGLDRVIWNGTTFVAVTSGGGAYRSACNSAGGAFNGGGGGLSWPFLGLLAVAARLRGRHRRACR